VADTWAPGQPTEESKRFVDAFRKKYNRMPATQAAFSYDAAMLLDAAVKSLKGNVSDRKAFSKAIAAAQFTSVRGAFKFGPNHFPVQNYHVYQVVSAGGKPEIKLQDANVLKSHADAYASQCPSR
jgi:branched-chain amino acid transport system substrate-binding protein